MKMTPVLCIKKLKGVSIITVAARHNLREMQAEIGADSHIDSSKSVLNLVLKGATTAADIAAEAVKLMELAKITPLRKDAVRGLEIVFSLQPQSGIAEQDYFIDAVKWAEGFFEIPILSAVIHNDEAAPHCHLIMLPLFNRHMIGSRLVGNKARLLAIQADFFEKVGRRYGLERQTPPIRYSKAARVKAAEMAVNHCWKNPKQLNEPTIRDALRESLTENPMPVIAALGLEMPKAKIPKPKTFVGIMTKRFKLEKAIGFGSDESGEPYPV